METLDSPRSRSNLGNGDFPGSISGKPRGGIGRGMYWLGSDGGSNSERGGGEGESIRDTRGGFACETLLKQINGGKYKQIWRDYNLLIPPVIPKEYVEVCTLQDGVSEKVLGRGGYGFVLEAILIYPRGQVKEVVLKESHRKDMLEQLLEEARICMYLERTGCVPICFGLTPSPTEKGVFRIIQECIGRGLTLHVAFRGLVPGSDYIQWLDIACQLAEGLYKIHLLDVLINDIKEDNILVDFSDQRPLIKYCDFGLSSYKKGVGYRNINRLRSPHLAPEHGGPAVVMTTKASDVFGLGRLIRNIYNTTKVPELIPIVKKTRAFEPTRRCSASEALRDLSSVSLQYIRRRRLELQSEVSASSSTSSLSASSTSSVSSSSAGSSSHVDKSLPSTKSVSVKSSPQSPAASSAQKAPGQSTRVPTFPEDALASATMATAFSTSKTSADPGVLASPGLPDSTDMSSSVNISVSSSYRTAAASSTAESRSPFVGSQMKSHKTSSANLPTLMSYERSILSSSADVLHTRDWRPELVMSELGSLDDVDPGGSITIIPVVRLEDISFGGLVMDPRTAGTTTTSQTDETASPVSSANLPNSPSFMDKVAGVMFRAMQFCISFFKP